MRVERKGGSQKIYLCYFSCVFCPCICTLGVDIASHALSGGFVICSDRQRERGDLPLLVLFFFFLFWCLDSSGPASKLVEYIITQQYDRQGCKVALLQQAQKMKQTASQCLVVWVFHLSLRLLRTSRFFRSLGKVDDSEIGNTFC